MSNELANILKDDFDLSITRKNVTWGVKHENGDTFYVWFDALLNYLFSIGYYDDREKFNEYWSNSIQICGKDNLKFQSYIFPALCLAAGIPQTNEVLIHGMILDEKGQKMSKSIGNVIDPIEQKNKFGLLPLKYYLIFGLNTFKSSKYSENDLIDLWNSDIVNGLGNTTARILHLIDIKNIDVSGRSYHELLDDTFKKQLEADRVNIETLFEAYDFHGVRLALNSIIFELNQRIANEKPFDKNCTDYDRILRELYFKLNNIIPFYQIILKEKYWDFKLCFLENKKVILFEKIQKEKV